MRLYYVSGVEDIGGVGTVDADEGTVEGSDETFITVPPTVVEVEHSEVEDVQGGDDDPHRGIQRDRLRRSFKTSSSHKRSEIPERIREESGFVG